MTIDDSFCDAIGRQLGAAIDMLDNAMAACPDSLWDDGSRQHAFWYIAYHTLFWLDLYLAGSVEGFAPPAPFTLEELDPAGVIPGRPYAKEALRGYLAHCRRAGETAIGAMNAERAGRRCRFGWGEADYLELLLYNLRHVQHHVGQLNLMIRQKTGSAPRWVALGAG
ncbi:MAG: DinB family protein [Spirochaetes bacterium]|nr:DinB family protein [Spirochaetota bacterium]